MTNSYESFSKTDPFAAALALQEEHARAYSELADRIRSESPEAASILLTMRQRQQSQLRKLMCVYGFLSSPGTVTGSSAGSPGAAGKEAQISLALGRRQSDESSCATSAQKEVPMTNAENPVTPPKESATSGHTAVQRAGSDRKSNRHTAAPKGRKRPPSRRERIHCIYVERKRHAAILHEHAGARQNATRSVFPVKRLNIGDREPARVEGIRGRRLPQCRASHRHGDLAREAPGIVRARTRAGRSVAARRAERHARRARIPAKTRR